MGFWRCSGRSSSSSSSSSSSNQHQHQQRRQQQQRRQRQRQQVALPWGSGAWLRRHSVAHRFSSSKCARGGWGRGKGGSVRFSCVAAAADASWWRWRRAPPPIIRPHRSRRPAADSRPVHHGGVRVAPASARERKGAKGRTRCRWCSGRRSAAISGISSTEIFDGDYAGVRQYSRGGGGGGGLHGSGYVC